MVHIGYTLVKLWLVEDVIGLHLSQTIPVALRHLKLY